MTKESTKIYQANTRLREHEKEEIESLAQRLDFSVSQLLRVSALNYGRYLANLKDKTFKPEIEE